jgi:hypothetical protein
MLTRSGRLYADAMLAALPGYSADRTGAGSATRAAGSETGLAPCTRRVETQYPISTARVRRPAMSTR